LRKQGKGNPFSSLNNDLDDEIVEKQEKLIDGKAKISSFRHRSHSIRLSICTMFHAGAFHPCKKRNSQLVHRELRA
jgi:hypothetical protein